MNLEGETSFCFPFRGVLNRIFDPSDRGTGGWLGAVIFDLEPLEYGIGHVDIYLTRAIVYHVFRLLVLCRSMR